MKLFKRVKQDTFARLDELMASMASEEIYDEYKINMNINKSPNKKIQSNSIINADGRDVSELATPSPVSNA
jgi:hypothetical protein